MNEEGRSDSVRGMRYEETRCVLSSLFAFFVCLVGCVLDLYLVMLEVVDKD